jgi:Fe2+ transport system protein FeoA
MDELRPGEVAKVVSVAALGADRRRLTDLGVFPGAEIAAELANPLGDPTAYLIRGALVALRRNQAATVTVERLP